MISHEIAKLAKLIGDPARANIILTLMESKVLTAGELAIRANISAQATSNHLKLLLEEKVIICESSGRHRYYQLSSSDVATVIESLGILIASNKVKPPRHHRLNKEICFARSCYDHLAGELGIKLVNALKLKEYIKKNNKSFDVTENGKRFFLKLEIDINALKNNRRQFAKACLDFTEREHHIAGSLGAALLDYLLSNRMLLRSKKHRRILILTMKGKLWLNETLNLNLMK